MNKDTKIEKDNYPYIKPPQAKVISHIRDIHGEQIPDDYYWMIDYFKKGPQSDAVISYLEQENKYLEQQLAHTSHLQEELFHEMKARIQEKDESVPVFKNGYFYYTRTETGQQYYKYCRKKGSLEAPEEILLDIDELAKDQPYYSAKGFTVSPDNCLLAYATDKVSRRQYTICVKDLTTGETLADQIPNTAGDPVWAANNQTLFYTENNQETLLSEKIRRHQLGNDVLEDITVYEEKDPANYIGVEKSKSGDYILIYSSATLSSVVYTIPAGQPQQEIRCFQPRVPEVLYQVHPLKDRFLILTNWEAPNFRLMECGLDTTDISAWKDVIPHRSDVLLEDISEFENFIAIAERKQGLIKISLMQNGKENQTIAFSEPAYMAGIGANPDFQSNKLRLYYTSMKTPMSVYDYEISSGSKTLLKQQTAGADFNSDHYTSERVFALAADGTEIPVSIVYKNGLKKDGKAPMLLYAYGSYGHSIDASFSSSTLSLLNRGFIFAIAHIRGGQEMGRHWYEQGRTMQKMNTFTDFISCGKYLVERKYTSRSHLYAQGGSAGGLLMGAISNMDPGLWNGIIAQVPFVDVVNTMLDETIPLTTNEYDEWGNPNEEQAYRYMKSYSPYENIKKQDYPNMLITTGLHDSQVQYFEPAKWVAKLRALKTGNQLLLLKTDMDFGHGGASGRFDYLKDIALNYAFLLSLEGFPNLTKD
ncbi:S9 family peptidase [Pedobacter antarcticus]|uniref:S9 family peptidase n=1 Tax=Pedobacter antarcticus TaxID=34086 RepID=UPI000889AFF7|nr:S9 family peptidase [Pedobacter antarcticus]SDM75949.1 oligopeptidase B [Pedobacter antarcticus]